MKLFIRAQVNERDMYEVMDEGKLLATRLTIPRLAKMSFSLVQLQLLRYPAMCNLVGQTPPSCLLILIIIHEYIPHTPFCSVNFFLLSSAWFSDIGVCPILYIV